MTAVVYFWWAEKSEIGRLALLTEQTSMIPEVILLPIGDPVLDQDVVRILLDMLASAYFLESDEDGCGLTLPDPWCNQCYIVSAFRSINVFEPCACT